MTIATPNQSGWGPLRQGLFHGSGNYLRLRNGCGWLYFALISLANPRTGKFQTTWCELAEFLGFSEQHVRSLAGHLRTKGYVTVHHKGNDQVLFAVQRWKPLAGRLRSTHVRECADTVGNGEQEHQPHVQSPIPPLAREVAAALGAEDQLDEIAALVAEYPEPLIRTFMESAKAVPEAKVKRSRYALFRWLLNHHGDNTRDAA